MRPELVKYLNVVGHDGWCWALRWAGPPWQRGVADELMELSLLEAWNAPDIHIGSLEAPCVRYGRWKRRKLKIGVSSAPGGDDERASKPPSVGLFLVAPHLRGESRGFAGEDGASSRWLPEGEDLGWGEAVSLATPAVRVGFQVRTEAGRWVPR